MTIITWDWKAQPPWPEIQKALEMGPRIEQVETGSDQYAIVIGADGPRSAQEHWDNHQFD